MFEKMKTKHVKCELDDLLDAEYLFNNVPWENYNRGDRMVFHIPKPTTVYFTNSYYDEIKEVEFDSVYITAFHSFAGNQYSFVFMLRDEEVGYVYSGEGFFDFNKEKVKQLITDYVNSRIKFMEKEIKELKEVIKRNED